MKKYIEALFILILVLVFIIFNLSTKRTSRVPSYTSPDKINVDINNNGIIDFGEQICIPDTETFELSINPNRPSFAKNLNKNDLIAMGYLADEFARKNILLKNVKVKFTGNKSPDCRYAEVYADGAKYSDILFNSGFASKNNKVLQDKFDENLKNARTLKLVLLNKKNNKYHKLDCDYGIKTGDYIILKSSQLPKDAVKCTYCLSKQNKKKITKPELKEHEGKLFKLADGDIKFILPDFTTRLKPNRNCDTQGCQSLLEEINHANESIDMAIYGYDRIPKITEAIKNAKSRGVRFRYVYDSVPETENSFYLDNNELSELAEESATDFFPGQKDTTLKIMHNKFIIIDRKTVFTGSMNISPTGLSDYNANTIIIINSPEIAELYSEEFEQMLCGRFHEYKKPVTSDRNFELNDSKVSIYFSPYDMTSKYILPLIYSAEEYIYVPTFILSHKKITKALIDAQKRGVDVKIIMDANGRTTLHSRYNELKNSKIQLKTEIFAGKMHSKTMIIDDKYIITGSMNFSNSGETRNDENTLIIENEKLAKFNKEFFMYLWGKIPDYWLNNAPAAESHDSIGSCSDGMDNDFDGLIDAKDPGCFPKKN